MATLGRLQVDLIANAQNFVREIRDAESAFQKTSRKMNDIGRTLTASVTLPIVAVGAAAFKMAADAAESVSKMEAVFGSAAQDMNAWVSELRDTVPETTANIQEFSASIGAMLTPLEMSETASTDMTQGVVQLAADLASLNNVPIREALDKLRAGLVGEAEPLRVWGVQLSAAKTEAKALEFGLIQEGQALSDTAKIMANWQVILGETTVAHGDAAATAGSAANQLKFFWAEARELATVVGGELLPVVTPLVSGLTGLLKGLQQIDPVILRFTVTVAGLAAAIGPLLLLASGLTAGLVALNPVVLAVGAAIVVLGGAVAAWSAEQDKANARLQTSTDLISRYRDEIRAGPREMAEAQLAGLRMQEEQLFFQKVAASAQLVELEAGPGGGRMAAEIRAAKEELEELDARWQDVRRLIAETEGAIRTVGDATEEITVSFDDQLKILDDQTGVLTRALELGIERKAVSEGIVDAFKLLAVLSDQSKGSLKEEVAITERRRALGDAMLEVADNELQTMVQTREEAGAFTMALQSQAVPAMQELERRTALAADEGRTLRDIVTDVGEKFGSGWLTAINAVGSGLGGLANDVAAVASAFVTGGPIAAAAAGVGRLIGGLFSGGDDKKALARIQGATQDWEVALDEFVDGLTRPLTEGDRLRAAVRDMGEDLIDLVAKFMSAEDFSAPKQIEDALRDAFSEGGAAAAFDVLKQYPLLFRTFANDFELLAEAIASADEEAKRLAEETERRAEETERRAREQEAEAARELLLQGRESAFDFGIRSATLGGDDRGAFLLELQRDQEEFLRTLQDLVDAGAITEGALLSWVDLLDQEATQAIREFDQALLDAAEAAREAQASFAEGLDIDILRQEGSDQEADVRVARAAADRRMQEATELGFGEGDPIFERIQTWLDNRLAEIAMKYSGDQATSPLADTVGLDVASSARRAVKRSTVVLGSAQVSDLLRRQLVVQETYLPFLRLIGYKTDGGVSVGALDRGLGETYRHGSRVSGGAISV